MPESTIDRMTREAMSRVAYSVNANAEWQKKQITREFIVARKIALNRAFGSLRLRRSSPTFRYDPPFEYEPPRGYKPLHREHYPPITSMIARVFVKQQQEKYR